MVRIRTLLRCLIIFSFELVVWHYCVPTYRWGWSSRREICSGRTCWKVARPWLLPKIAFRWPGGHLVSQRPLTQWLPKKNAHIVAERELQCMYHTYLCNFTSLPSPSPPFLSFIDLGNFVAKTNCHWKIGSEIFVLPTRPWFYFAPQYHLLLYGKTSLDFQECDYSSSRNNINKWCILFTVFRRLLAICKITKAE